jgi:hypothetical protein
MAARATCEKRSTWSALDHTSVRAQASTAVVALDRTSVRAQASAAAVVLDRRCSAIKRTNRGFTHLSPNLPLKPRLHNKDLQHNKTLK